LGEEKIHPDIKKTINGPLFHVPISAIAKK
jgi:hypothetical protein